MRSERPEANRVLVVLGDRSHLVPAKQTLASAVVAGGWSGDRLLVTNCRDENLLDEFRRNGVLVHQAGTLGEDVRQYKYEIFGEVFRRWRNVLYLDVDIMVTGPIDHLGEVRGFWAAPDFYHCLGEQFTKDHDLLAREYDMRALSFNGGVLAFSTDAIASGTRGRLAALLAEHRGRTWLFDQPPLNLVFYGRWRRLSQAYNYFAIMPRSLIANRHTASILHFPGPRKPWYEDHPLHGQWAASLARFGNEPAPRLTWNGRFRRAMAPAYFLCLWQLRRYVRHRCPTLHRALRRLRGRPPGLWPGSG